MPFYCEAQDNSWHISGKILGAKSNLPIRDVEIFNLKSHVKACSDSMGNFTIPMAYSDSLQIFHSDYRAYVFTLAQNPEKHNGVMYIYLQGDTLYFRAEKISGKSKATLKDEITNTTVKDSIHLLGVTRYDGPRGEEKPTIKNIISYIKYNTDKHARLKRKLRKARQIDNDKAYKGVEKE